MKRSSERTSGLELNRTTEYINDALWASLNSVDRQPYGTRSFLETDFILDEMAQFIRLLQKTGLPDRPLEEVATLRPLLEQGLGDQSGCASVFDVGTLSTAVLARDLRVRRCGGTQDFTGNS